MTQSVGVHGSLELPAVAIDSYNVELRDNEGFVGDRASKGAFLAILEDWRERMGREATARWGVVAADRHRADTYVEIVAFPDHASAMRNSEHPVTTDFAKRMQEVTEGEASFRNLDVQRVLRM